MTAWGFQAIIPTMNSETHCPSPNVPDTSNATDGSFPFIQTALLDWFAKHRRPLPWRADYTPYRTWIAEVMLQQTQMERGVAYFLRWMERFPTIASVAEADEASLLKAWEGLGYYRRVRNIQKSAQQIMERHNGCFPEQYEDILQLAGIGDYTAGAIASTAFNQDVPCVDGNVERVFSRIFNIDTPPKEQPAKAWIRQTAHDLIPQGRARDFNQALMEFGALVCRKKPLCESCPLRGTCVSLHLGLVSERPVVVSKGTPTRLEVTCGILIHNGKVFLQRREDNDVWGGLWEFAGGCVEANETPEQTILREWQEETGFQTAIVKPLGLIRHAYTTYRIRLHCYLLRLENAAPDALPTPPKLNAATAYEWVEPMAVHDYPMPAPHRKLADTCGLFDKQVTKQ